jgi:hypothetical protein
MSRREQPLAIPREMSSRSSRVSTRRERRRANGNASEQGSEGCVQRLSLLDRDHDVENTAAQLLTHRATLAIWRARLMEIIARDGPDRVRAEEALVEVDELDWQITDMLKQIAVQIKVVALSYREEQIDTFDQLFVKLRLQ